MRQFPIMVQILSKIHFFTYVRVATHCAYIPISFERFLADIKHEMYGDLQRTRSCKPVYIALIYSEFKFDFSDLETLIKYNL